MIRIITKSGFCCAHVDATCSAVVQHITFAKLWPTISDMSVEQALLCEYITIFELLIIVSLPPVTLEKCAKC